MTTTEHDDEEIRMTDREVEVRARLNTGELYVDAGEGLAALAAERVQGKELCYDYNHTRPGQQDERTRLLGELFGSVGRGVWIEPPFHAAYGTHIHVGDDFYANFNLVVVDDADVYIGDRVLIGPHVTLSTAGHPVDPVVRRGGQQFSMPIRLEDDVWLGANVVVLPGVTVGAGSVVAAGAVVSRHVPAGVVAGGVPCRVLREIGPDDAEFVYRGPRPEVR